MFCRIGKPHRAETSSGKMMSHKSTRKDGARSGDDMKRVIEGKNDRANCLLMATGWVDAGRINDQ